MRRTPGYTITAAGLRLDGVKIRGLVIGLPPGEADRAAAHLRLLSEVAVGYRGGLAYLKRLGLDEVMYRGAVR